MRRGPFMLPAGACCVILIPSPFALLLPLLALLLARHDTPVSQTDSNTGFPDAPGYKNVDTRGRGRFRPKCRDFSGIRLR